MTETPWQDRDTLHKLYHEKGLSQMEVADELGCAACTVSKWMDKHGIEVKDARGRGDLSASDTPAPFGTWVSGGNGVYYEYWLGENAMVEVHRLLAVAEYGFDVVCDKDIHHKNEIPWLNTPENIEPLSRSQHMRHHNKPEGDT